MKKFLNLTIILISLSILVLINGCDKSTSYEHDIQIKNNIHDSLKIYPIKNLEDLYDIEGAKSEDFKKGDKGKWVIHSSFARNKGKAYVDEGMFLHINRNTREASGYYHIRKYFNDGKADRKKYKVKMINGKVIPNKNVRNENIRNKIKNFEFFGQYEDLNKELKDKKVKYYSNSNVPDFQAIYKLNEDDKIMDKLKKRYPIPYNSAEMIIQGDGRSEDKVIGDKRIKIKFKQTEFNYYDTLIFEPTDESE